MIFLIISWLQKCKDLVSRLLPILIQDPPHGKVKDATDAWSQHHDYLPLHKEISLG